MGKEIKSPEYRVLVEKLIREIRLNQEMIQGIQEELHKTKKGKENNEETIKQDTMLHRQIHIAKGYIEYHREMISVIQKTDREVADR